MHEPPGAKHADPNRTPVLTIRHSTTVPAPRKRRSELTFKHNALLGRHGWLRLTPAYSVRLVQQLLDEHDSAKHVVDPFSGTGTTPLCAVERGHSAVSFDINPFLVWLGNLKLRRFTAGELMEVEDAARSILEQSLDGDAEQAPLPALSNIRRWWNPVDLAFIRRLLMAIRSHSFDSDGARDLLLVSFCRTMIALSNAAFNHQSMSFKDTALPQTGLFDDDHQERHRIQFRKDVAVVEAGASQDPGSGRGRVVLADSRNLPAVFDADADLLITSPPYPNRMSYIRELRPYMYWLGFLEDKRQAGELDWLAIGGTWGVATSRVASWTKAADVFFPDYLAEMLHRIEDAEASSGRVLSRYVGKYFEDIWRHIHAALRTMRPGAELHYIVGNSKFYDVLVPTERIYSDMLLEAGACSVRIDPLRKRNSKKELIEFDVVARL